MQFFGQPEKPMLPGYVAISSTLLSGVYLRPRWRLFYDGFFDLIPVDVIGNSIRVYWVERWPEREARTEVTDASVENGGVHARLANDLLFGLDWPDHAIVHYRAALDRDPDNLSVVENLGLALIEAGKLEDALAMLHRAVNLDPARGDARYRLAAALLKHGDEEEALIEAETAARMRPDDPVAHDILGVTRQANGKLEAAKASFERALQLAPGYEDARERLRRLQEIPMRYPRDRYQRPGR
jgi:tetratricopeptide (TPR) repeat protein